MAWSLLSGFESRIGPDTLDLLIDATAERIAAELANPTTGKTDPLWGPFLFLAKVMSLRLIERFEARRGSSLERNLGLWLEERGPNNEHSRGHREEKALAVLQRIGGEAVSRVAEQWLREGQTFWALREAIDLAIARPTENIADLLFEIAMRESVEGSGYPIAQVQAVGALLAIGKTDLAVRGAMKWGLKLSNEVVALFAEHRPTETDLQPALAVILEPGSSLEPNAVFAVGLGGRAVYVPAILDILGGAPRGSELARACLFALDAIGDSSPETVLAFLDHFTSQGTEYVCARGLLRVRTPEALAALKGRLRGLSRPSLSSSDTAVFIAINLLDMPETAVEVASTLWQELDRHRILFVAQGDLSAFAELRLPEVDEWLSDIALGTSSHYRDFDTQIGAIRALARYNSNRAFDAALRLVELESSDREQAPELLLGIDSERALPLFHESLRDEAEVPTLLSIGEHLQAACREATLIEWLSDPLPRVREGACIAAEAFSWSADLERAITALLNDSDWDVRSAANTALDRIWHTREVDGLVEALLAEADATRRWSLLDVALGAGHPGLWRQPPWLNKLWRGRLPLAMYHRVNDRLTKRRQEVRDELKNRTRPSS